MVPEVPATEVLPSPPGPPTALVVLEPVIEEGVPTPPAAVVPKLTPFVPTPLEPPPPAPLVVKS